MKIASSEHEENTGRKCCVHKLFWISKQKTNNLCTQHVLHMFYPRSPHVLSLPFSCTELLIQWTIFCGLFETRISASEKDLPVTANVYQIFIFIKISVWKCIYKFVSSFQMSCTASTFMQLPFRKGGNGTESLLPLSLYRSRPTQPKINFMWEICTYCSSICTLGLLLNSKSCLPKPKSKIIQKSFFCFKHFLLFA